MKELIKLQEVSNKYPSVSIYYPPIFQQTTALTKQACIFEIYLHFQVSKGEFPLLQLF